jgi:hypothetical protein
VTAKAELAALSPKTVIAIEKFIALKTASVGFGAEAPEARPDRTNVGNTILLFAFDAIARDVALELAGQILLKFARTHNAIQLAIRAKACQVPESSEGDL